MTTNLFVILYFQVQMGRSGNKKKDSERKCACILFAEETGTPVIEYLKRLAPDIIIQELPPGEIQAPANVPGVLIPAAQEIFFRIIHMYLRELESNSYFNSISEASVVITESDVPKLNKNNLMETSKKPEEAAIQKRDNVRRIRDMLDRVLIATSDLYKRDRRVNPELSHLLGLMKNYQAGKCLFNIKYHYSVIPPSNRGPAYILLYDHTMDVLRIIDPMAYNLVVSGVEIPENWDTRCLGNEQLADSLRRGEYDLQATRWPDTTELRLIPMKYIRNRSAHAQEGAAAPLTTCGVRFKPSDLARALYIRMPLAFVSLQKSLHFVGALQNVMVLSTYSQAV